VVSKGAVERQGHSSLVSGALVNEVAVKVNIIPAVGNTSPFIAANGYYVSLGLEYEMYIPPGMPPYRTGSNDSCTWLPFPTQFNYQIEDGSGNYGSQNVDIYTDTSGAVHTSDAFAATAFDDGNGSVTNLRALTGVSNGPMSAHGIDVIQFPGTSGWTYYSSAMEDGLGDLADSAAYALDGGTALVMDHQSAPPLSPQAPTAHGVGAQEFFGSTLQIQELSFRLAVCTRHNGGTMALVTQLIPFGTITTRILILLSTRPPPFRPRRARPT